MERLLTASELAEWLSISERKAYSMKREIGFIKLGGNVRFEQSAIEAYLKKCRQPPVQPETHYTSNVPRPPSRRHRKVTAETICQLLNEQKVERDKQNNQK
ncbi:helix-turn-helix domain-containing protein [Vreelandella massiliensis]|uniref:helix-turn-helix domain-containing protein n=1 Tax=Vreelandella massiliensis TaxID=1816686 RepID=UPI00096A2BDD|nr:helix-turn-helix domain-containing protein [Halomonas massiliensis]